MHPSSRQVAVGVVHGEEGCQHLFSEGPHVECLQLLPSVNDLGTDAPGLAHAPNFIHRLLVKENLRKGKSPRPYPKHTDMDAVGSLKSSTM